MLVNAIASLGVYFLVFVPATISTFVWDVPITTRRNLICTKYI